MIFQATILKLIHIISHMLHIFILASCIKYNIEMIIFYFSNNTIICNSTLFIHKKRKTSFSMMKSFCINYSHMFEECTCVFSSEMKLTHMRNIKHSTWLSSMIMFFYNTSLVTWIQYWHFIPSKFNHLTSKLIFVIFV